MIFFISFYDLPACNKKVKILSLATAFIAHLRSQFNHVFALLIFMPRFKGINFYQNKHKFTLFLQKKLQNLPALGASPQEPLAFDHQNSLPIADFWRTGQARLTASIQKFVSE